MDELPTKILKNSIFIGELKIRLNIFFGFFRLKNCHYFLSVSQKQKGIGQVFYVSSCLTETIFSTVQIRGSQTVVIAIPRGN